MATQPSTIDAEATDEQRARLSTSIVFYFPRRLRITDDHQQSRIVDESGLLAIAGPKIVLGEPGMGKSELIRELGRRLEVEPVSAVRFMLSKNPAQFVVAGKPLLIDGLDEAMARREGDAVDMILAQLEDAGSPDFILSCRVREWQGRSVTNLRQIYGVDPAIFTLEALDRGEASTFLVRRYPNADSGHVLKHLEEHGIADLYGNPLTLGLMGKVAERDKQLPATRAALFERVCTLTWPEHDPNRQDSGLGKISEDQALTAAGAIMAGMLLTGSDAVSLAGPGQVQDGDVRLTDIEILPGAGAARAVFASKLFHSVGVGRAKAIHRVIAEYLGARWLAQQATTTRAQRRLLLQLQGSGAVPASLRGLHAWLAFHSPAMAKAIIAVDPFGVLRYGESAGLTTEQANWMFDGLLALAKIDPYFRAQDWDSHTAAGLMIPNLSLKIETTIASLKSNEHLRSLLIEGLKDTSLAADLADTLEAVMLSSQRFYRERDDAAEALMPYRDRDWWRRAIAILRDQGTEDSTRLARKLIEAIDCDVTDELLVATVLAEIGLTISPLPRSKERRRVHTIRHYERIVDLLPVHRISNVLDLLTDYALLLQRTDWRDASDLAHLIVLLVGRAIDEDVIGDKDAAMLWNWLGALQHTNHFLRNERAALQELLNVRNDLRRAVQCHALFVARTQPTIWMCELDMARRMVGLAGRPMDVAWLLERMAGANNKDPALRADWCDLMQLGVRRNGFDPELRAASRKFQGGDQQLESFVLKLENPKKSSWERREERRAAKREKKRRINAEIDRRHYGANNAALRVGELGEILFPAKVYLGLVSDLAASSAPGDRLTEWLGAELASDFMIGFEAVLHRADIPSPTDVATSYAEGKTWNYCFAIMAGLLARHRGGLGFADVSTDVQTIGLILCLNEGGMCTDDDVPALRAELENSVIKTAKDREKFARLWIEPSLAAGAPRAMGLYRLAHDENWHATGEVLAAEWLRKFNNVPENIDLELVDCLTHSGALASLASIAEERVDMVFHSVNHLLAWLSIDVLVRFDSVVPNLAGISTLHPEFIWFLRDRIQLERRGTALPVSVAQAKWIVSQFRTQWPYATLVGSGSGITNSYDATDFLRAMVNRIANDTSAAAEEAMRELISAPDDSYTGLVRHMAAEQQQKRAEEEFAPLSPKELNDLLSGGAPSNADDLKSLVLEEIAVAQKILIGDDLDQVRDFWNDVGIPYDENRCRDRLAAMVGPELMRYGIQRITEADMPKTKRADLAFAFGQLQLPMEVKGQWHSEVWEAATDQLDHKYLIDWRSERRGIYCVLWFGDLPSRSGRRLQAPPQGLEAPTSAETMRKMLIERIPESRRALIDVVVLDLTAGKR